MSHPAQSIHPDLAPALAVLDLRPIAPRADIALDDWELVLEAVRSKLDCPDGVRPLITPGDLQECVGALERMRDALGAQVARRQQLELDLLSARAALAQVRAALAGTQPGTNPRVRKLAPCDWLGALPDRGLFRDKLAYRLDRADARTALALLYVDLDGFAAVNEMHGAEVGDELLGLVAARLARMLRGDDIVGRIGGDEFACMLGDVRSRDELTGLAKRLTHVLAAPFQVGSAQVGVHASVGIAIGPQDGATPEVLLKHAEDALYRAKREQIGFAFFDRRFDT